MRPLASIAIEVDFDAFFDYESLGCTGIHFTGTKTMLRKEFLKRMTLTTGAVAIGTSLKSLADTFPEDGRVMPTFFIGHGNPMNALEDNSFVRGWKTSPSACGTNSPRLQIRHARLSNQTKTGCVRISGGFSGRGRPRSRKPEQRTGTSTGTAWKPLASKVSDTGRGRPRSEKPVNLCF